MQPSYELIFFTNLYLNKLTVYILIEVITLDPGRYFLKHWMRVLPIENSARGGFIRKKKIQPYFIRNIISVLERTLFWKSEVSGSHGRDLVHE